MCAVCRKNPCDSRCPNAEEPKSIYTCEWCEEPIYEGDKYMDTPEGPVCKDCIEGMPKAWRYPAERQSSCGYRSERRCQFQCNSGKEELFGKGRYRIRSNHDAEKAYQSWIFLRSRRS